MNYPAIVEQIIGLNPLPELEPRNGPAGDARRLLAGLQLEDIFDSPIVSYAAAYACLAGLWLHAGGLDEAHQIVQQEPNELLAKLRPRRQALEAREARALTTTFAYWHGIMHRREADYGNAKYWFYRVPEQAIFPELARGARELTANESLDAPAAFLASQTTWAPAAFVDLCQAVAHGRSQSQELARKVALLEWQLLFADCYRTASGA